MQSRQNIDVRTIASARSKSIETIPISGINPLRTDRAFWERKADLQSLGVVDQIVNSLRTNLTESSHTLHNRHGYNFAGSILVELLDIAIYGRCRRLVNTRGQLGPKCVRHQTERATPGDSASRRNATDGTKPTCHSYHVSV